MNIVRAAGAMMVGLLPLFAGCAQADMGGEEDVGTVQQAGGNDKGNGLDPQDANPCWDDMVQAMSVPIHVNGALNPALPQSVKAGGECVPAFEYAQECAEILSTATGWFTGGGLGNLAKQEVMACMLGLVNPIEGVQVCLSGADVIDGGVSACLGQSVEEAVWQTSLGRDGGVTLHMWPLHPSVACTTNALKQVFASRLCGPNAQEPADCGVDLRTDIETVCSESNGSWTCLGRPAILTRVGATDWLTLFPAPGCDPIPQ